HRKAAGLDVVTDECLEGRGSQPNAAPGSSRKTLEHQTTRQYEAPLLPSGRTVANVIRDENGLELLNLGGVALLLLFQLREGKNVSNRGRVADRGFEHRLSFGSIAAPGLALSSEERGEQKLVKKLSQRRTRGEIRIGL